VALPVYLTRRNFHRIRTRVRPQRIGCTAEQYWYLVGPVLQNSILYALVTPPGSAHVDDCCCCSAQQPQSYRLKYIMQHTWSVACHLQSDVMCAGLGDHSMIGASSKQNHGRKFGQSEPILGSPTLFSMDSLDQCRGETHAVGSDQLHFSFRSNCSAKDPAELLFPLSATQASLSADYHAKV
jgi:hypothetical protein